MQLNASRIKVLQAQDDLVNAMKEAASQELLKVSHHDSHHHHHLHPLHDYQGLMKALVVQVIRPQSYPYMFKITRTSAKIVKGVIF